MYLVPLMGSSDFTGSYYSGHSPTLRRLIGTDEGSKSYGKYPSPLPFDSCQKTNLFNFNIL